jgi:hypothetical protein
VAAVEVLAVEEPPLDELGQHLLFRFARSP